MRCFFVGHSDTPLTVRERLKEEVERHICQFKVTDFVVGRYGAFDRMAVGVIAQAKREHPEITLGILLAYHPTTGKGNLAANCDYTVYPMGMECIPKRFAIVRANQYMIKNSDFLIAYAWKPGSNARKLLEYAYKQEKLVIVELPHG